MAVKWEKVTPGSVLLDIHSHRMGNTTMREIGCWEVRIISIDHAAGTAIASWNGNPTRKMFQRDICKLYVKPPKQYRDQCDRKGREARPGYLAPVEDPSPVSS